MSERDVIEFDVLIVGGGPSGLATAIRLKQLNAELSVCLIDKASQIGAHILSGAVIEPQPLDELLPGWRDNPPPLCVPVRHDEFAYLSKTRRIKAPVLPPQMNNHGNFIVSLGALCAWLAPQAEALGVEVFPGFAASEPLFDAGGQRVIGVRIGDMGVDKAGQPKDGYTQGIDIHARTTVLAEGCRGSLAKQLIRHFGLDAGVDPQTYGIGLKELWQLPAGRSDPGLVQHTIGWPLKSDTYGGSFIYHLTEDRVAVGFVVGLDYRDPNFSPFEAFQQFKHHPTVKPLLEGGSIISSGARALVEGGLQSLPRLQMPGALLVGDAAGMINVPKIKGTHLAMKSGMTAAEALFEALRDDAAREVTAYPEKLRKTWLWDELYRVRNIRPAFYRGLLAGVLYAGIDQYIFRGKAPWTFRVHADHDRLGKASDYPTIDYPKPDGVITFDKLSSVYISGTNHEENQPSHLTLRDASVPIAVNLALYDAPEQRYCPAGVYEIVRDADGSNPRLQINAQNCVHCKTCDIMDPYEIITWVTPEGGGGPKYVDL